jgi:hypothetical protein
MRCPKCGYISYDHLEECLKCKKNIRAASDSLNGTVYNVAAPAFLLFGDAVRDAEPEEVEEFVDAFDSEDDYLDDALGVLVGEQDDEEEAFDLASDDDEGPDISLGEMDGFQAEGEEDRGEIEIDLSQFEPVEEQDQFSGASTEESPEIPVPDELSDLSDLVPPEMEENVEAPAAAKAPVSEKPSDDLELGDLDFDLALGDLEAPESQSPGLSQEPALALDDIDFSDALDLGTPEGSAKKDKVMDDDLDFELDLGGLSIHKEE